MNKDIKFYYYDIPTTRGFYWGKFILASNGLFAVYSDFCNGIGVCLRGPDVRKDLLQMIEECSETYINQRLFHHEYNFSYWQTAIAIKKYIIECLRDKTWTKEIAREEWNLLKDTICYETNEYGFYRWHEETRLSDTWELQIMEYSVRVAGLWKECMPKLAEMIREELKEEELGIVMSEEEANYWKLKNLGNNGD